MSLITLPEELVFCPFIEHAFYKKFKTKFTKVIYADLKVDRSKDGIMIVLYKGVEFTEFFEPSFRIESLFGMGPTEYHVKINYIFRLKSE